MISHRHINQPSTHDRCTSHRDVLGHNINPFDHLGLDARRRDSNDRHSCVVCSITAVAALDTVHTHALDRAKLSIERAEKSIERHILLISSDFEAILLAYRAIRNSARGFTHLLVLMRLWREISAAANFCKW